MKRLESLVDAGFEMPTLTAFIWVPLVFVAWADGNADALEKKAILDVLATKGFAPQTAARTMILRGFVASLSRFMSTMTILKHRIVRCVLVKIAKGRIVEAGLMK